MASNWPPAIFDEEHSQWLCKNDEHCECACRECMNFWGVCTCEECNCA